MDTLPRRLWSKVDRSAGPDGCWPFTGSIRPDGHGQISRRGRGPDGAHRVAYELTHGPIPRGAEIKHACARGACCNPKHLVLAAPVEQRARFWSKVSVGAAHECWPWSRSTNAFGYGLFRVDRRKVSVAHRVAYEMAVGPIGDLHVLHRCDNPPCCNPDHLFLGTEADNKADCVAKGRSSKGENQADAKLTEAMVREARAAFPATNVVQLSRRYGVSNVTMWKAVHGRTWRHVA